MSSTEMNGVRYCLNAIKDRKSPLDLIHYEKDTRNRSYRVWPNWYSGDTFYMVPIVEWETHLPALLNEFPGKLIEGMPEDDED